MESKVKVMRLRNNAVKFYRADLVINFVCLDRYYILFGLCLEMLLNTDDSNRQLQRKKIVTIRNTHRPIRSSSETDRQ